MLKCPYCFEPLSSLNEKKCPTCQQFIIDNVIPADFPSLDKKPCVFCGKKILKEASFCRFCRKWMDDVLQAAEELDPDDLV